jgi:hypothetical protein
MAKEINSEFFGNAVDLDISMRELEIFLVEIENFFETRKKSLNYENKYYEDLNEKFLFYYWFPNLERRNFIISLVTIIENETRAYCNTLYKHKKVPIKYSELRGSAIEKFLNYTEKLAGIKFDFSEEMIKSLKLLSELRNCIIHTDGYIKDCSNKQAIIDFSDKFGEIKNGRIYLSKEFCQDALELVKKFFNEIFKSGYFKYEC